MHVYSVVEGGVHLGLSHAYIPRSDSPSSEPAACVLGVRFSDASEKNGCHVLDFLPLSSSSRYYHAPPGLSPDRSPAPKPLWKLGVIVDRSRHMYTSIYRHGLALGSSDILSKTMHA
jgi:hypothetical protein